MMVLQLIYPSPHAKHTGDANGDTLVNIEHVTEF